MSEERDRSDNQRRRLARGTDSQPAQSRAEADRGRRSVTDRLRIGASHVVSDSFLSAFSLAARYHPRARLSRHEVEVVRDVPYLGTGRAAHRMDIYRPTRLAPPWPIVLYIHGGAFRMLSKDSHWVMALGFARRGYMVCNISYRLAPRDPFPAAIEDACDALVWVARHAEAWGGDLGRLVIAGESAGANLATGLALASSYRRPEPYARRVWDTYVAPAAVLPACGLLEVSRPRRFSEAGRRVLGLDSLLAEVERSYLGEESEHPSLDFADPLVALERAEPPDRPLPPFFIAVGTSDPILDDSRRLERALVRLRVPCEARYYRGQVHAFHAMVWRDPAKRCWRDTYRFLDRHLSPHSGRRPGRFFAR